MGDFGTFEKAARRAEDRAQQARYGGLYLRALAFLADGKFDAGDRPGGWKLACAGLERYWSGQFPAMQGYNLYYDISYAADSAGQSNLQLASGREAAALIDADEDMLLRAWAHINIAKAATAAHQPDVAKQQYAEAARLYALAPQTDAIRAYRIENEIRTAQLEARQSGFDAAFGNFPITFSPNSFIPPWAKCSSAAIMRPRPSRPSVRRCAWPNKTWRP
jgi:hypothetical protein